MESINATNLFSVEGIVAVVTGGGTGIGQMMAKALAQNGARKVYIIGRRENKLNETAAFYPNVIIPVTGDVTIQDTLKSMADRVRRECGYINILIANAGVTGPSLDALKPRYTLSDFVTHAWKTPMEDFNATYGLNCTALYYTVLAFLELLDEGNKQKKYPNCKSQVIATAANAAFLRIPKVGYAYTSSKAAVVSMVKSLSTFCVIWGIRFNAIAPGLFPVASDELFKQYHLDKSKSYTEEGAFSRAYQPAERAGSLEDIAGITLYMASKAGAFLNGSVILVDGGKIATMPASY